MMKDDGADITMVIDWVVLGVIIAKVSFARCPEYVKLALGDAVLYPIKAHVDGF